MDLKLLDSHEPAVLIVEPSRQFASLLRHILSVGGVRKVHHVADAYGALEVIKTAHVDIAILDSELTGISALKLTRVIRRASDSPNRALPIILLSDRPTRRLIDDAMRSGVSCYVRKPVSADTLLQRMKWALEPAAASDDQDGAEDAAEDAAATAEHNTTADDEMTISDTLIRKDDASDDDVTQQDFELDDVSADDVTLDDTAGLVATLAV